jgi:predicted transposase/invertase (TIGR01784 family)
MAKLPIDADILPPSDDRIFKLLLTHPDAAPVLVDIVSAAIGRTVTAAVVHNNELPVEDVEAKGERLDVNCTVDNGDQVDVEMQSARMEEFTDGFLNFLNKYIYYLTDLHSSQPLKGKKYFDMQRTFQVIFTCYTVLPNRPVFSILFSLRFSDGEQLSDQINMIIIELSKLKTAMDKPVPEMTLLEKWSIFLGYAQSSEHRDLINEIIESKKEIAMAAELLMSVSRDADERARMMSRKKFETDMTSNMLTAEARGEANKARIVAKKMKDKGMDVNTIIELTGLPVDDVLKL